MSETKYVMKPLPSGSRLRRSESKVSRYIDCKFEMDMKILLGKFDRMEALVERLIEIVAATQQPQQHHIISQEPLSRKRQREESNYDEHSDEESEFQYVEEQVEVFQDAEEQEYNQKMDEDIEVFDPPQEFEKFPFEFPICSLSDLEDFDDLMVNNKDAKDKMVDFFQTFVEKDKNFKEIVRNIVIDGVLFQYSEQKGDLRNLYTFSLVLKEAYSKQKDANNYWQRIDALHYQTIQPTKINPELRETTFKFPIHNAAQLSALDIQVRESSTLRNQLTEVMQSLYIQSGRDNTNFLQKLIGKDVVEEVGYSNRTKKPYTITDFLIFNTIFAEILGLDGDVKELEDTFKLCMNKLRHRFYSQVHRLRKKEQ